MTLENTPNIEERVNAILDLPDTLYFDRNLKMDLLLITFGFKKGTEINLTGLLDKTNEISSSLVDLGFELRVTKHKSNDFELGISDTLATLERMEALAKEQERNDYEYGEIYGFPQSAIRAFAETKRSQEAHKEKFMSNSDFPPEIWDEEYFYLLNFAVTKENWRKEIETLKDRYEILKKYAPDFLSKYIEDSKKLKKFYLELEAEVCNV